MVCDRGGQFPIVTLSGSDDVLVLLFVRPDKSEVGSVRLIQVHDFFVPILLCGLFNLFIEGIVGEVNNACVAGLDEDGILFGARFAYKQRVALAFGFEGDSGTWLVESVLAESAGNFNNALDRHIFQSAGDALDVGFVGAGNEWLFHEPRRTALVAFTMEIELAVETTDLDPGNAIGEVFDFEDLLAEFLISFGVELFAIDEIEIPASDDTDSGHEYSSFPVHLGL